MNSEITPKKHLGQNFLGSEEIAREIAQLAPQKNILEIGPGLGMLTQFLAMKAKKLTAVEIDGELVVVLKRREFPNTVIKHGDALKEDFSQFDTVVGALPYNISSRVIEKFVKSGVETGIFIVQKELADRMVAAAGTRDYSRFTILVQSSCDVEVLEVYPPSLFWPEPKVHSALVKLEKKKAPIQFSSTLINALFQHKNQKVRKALKHSRHLIGGKIAKLTGRLLEKKVIELTIEQLSQLSKQFEKNTS